MAQVAMPHDQGAVRLDHLEGVGTGALNGHGESEESFLHGLTPPSRADRLAAGRARSTKSDEEPVRRRMVTVFDVFGDEVTG